jgi:hypothetical protein
MNSAWTVARLIDELAARGTQPAIVQAGEGPIEEWSGRRLAVTARTLAVQLTARHGVTRGTPVGIHAPN